VVLTGEDIIARKKKAQNWRIPEQKGKERGTRGFLKFQTQFEVKESGE